MDHLKKLISFDRWANAEYLRALVAQPQAEQRAVRLLSHIVSAQMLWMDRILRREQRVGVWPEWGLEEWGKHVLQSADEWQAYVGVLQADVARSIVRYQNSKGERWEDTVEDIVLHVANHGTHHRAQIATLLRAGGTAPPYTDYIEGVRRGKVQL